MHSIQLEEQSNNLGHENELRMISSLPDFTFTLNVRHLVAEFWLLNPTELHL
jgi:hypothetical protein